MTGEVRPDWPERPTSEQSLRAAAVSPDSRPRLRETLTILSLRKWSILVVMLLVMATALWLSGRQTPIYSSEARVLVTSTDPGVEAPNLETEAQLVSSFLVAELVAEKNGLQGDPRRLLDDLVVERPSDSEILAISYRHPDPAFAQQTAQGFAEAYLEYRQSAVTQTLGRSAMALQDQQVAFSQRLELVERRLVRLDPLNPRRRTLETEAAALQQLILNLQLELLRVPEDISVGRIVQPPPLPSSPVSPNHFVNGGLGFVGGLALGIALAFVRDRLSGRLGSVEEIELAVGAPVLGSIPRLSAWRRRKQAYLVTLSRRQSPAAEAYRILRTNVLSAASDYKVKTIAVTSAQPGEGKSATVANLGVVMASAGKRVSLVSADLRRPRLHLFFGLDGRYGLADVLAGRIPLDDATQDVALPRAPESRGIDPEVFRLRILPSGIAPDDPAELLSSETMAHVLRQLEEVSDIVLIDLSPVMPVSDALIVAPEAQGVLVVIGPSGFVHSSVLSARQQLDKVGARVLGAVLNGPDSAVSPTYYGY